MKPTLARSSDMPGGKVYSLWWGDQTGIRQKGIIQYTISSNQSKAMPNWIRTYLFNGYRRLAGEAVFWVIPFTLGYGIYSWANRTSEYQQSKAAHIAAGAHHDAH